MCAARLIVLREYPFPPAEVCGNCGHDRGQAVEHGRHRYHRCARCSTPLRFDQESSLAPSPAEIERMKALARAAAEARRNQEWVE